MRKFIILLLITILFVPAIPSLAAGTGDDNANNKYEVTIYPNGKGLFRLFGNYDDLVIGDVGVTYEVDREKNEVNIYFEESIYVSDIISEGNTVHKSIKVDSEEEIKIERELKTDGFVYLDVKTINLKYDDISKVDSITIQSGEITDFSGGLLDNKYFTLYKKDGYLETTNETKITDNNLKSNVRLGYFGSDIGKLVYEFSEPVNINSFRIFASEIRNESSFYLTFFDLEGNTLKSYFVNQDIDFIDGRLVNIDIFDCVKITITNRNVTFSEPRIHEFNVYSDIPNEPPQEEVSGLDYTLQGNNVTLSWTNPSSDKFEGVKIYRDGEYIETTTGESFTETLPIGTYQYRITTLEDGQESEGVTIDISVQTIPTPVKGIRINNTTSSSASITWDLNPKAQNISKYIVYVNGKKHGEIENPPYQLEDLEVGKKYDISVSAVNPMGEGEISNPVSYTPSKIEDLKSTIKVGEIFSYIGMLFTKVWPLLALSITFIFFPHITNAIKSVVGSRRSA